MIEQFKNKLEDKKKEVSEELSSFASKNKNVSGDFKANFPDYGNHPDENAQEVATYENSLSLEKTLENDLGIINKALKKIEQSKYGLCENCDEEIDIKRLNAYPEAESCIKCAKST